MTVLTSQALLSLDHQKAQAGMHMCMRQPAPPIPKGIHKVTEFYIFSPWLHCFPPLPVIPLFFSGLMQRICVKTPQCQPKPKLRDLLFSYPTGFFYAIFLFQALKIQTVSGAQRVGSRRQFLSLSNFTSFISICVLQFTSAYVFVLCVSAVGSTQQSHGREQGLQLYFHKAVFMIPRIF